MAQQFIARNYEVEKLVSLFSKTSEILFERDDVCSTLFGSQHMWYSLIAYFLIFQFLCNDILNSTICRIHLVRTVG